MPEKLGLTLTDVQTDMSRGISPDHPALPSHRRDSNDSGLDSPVLRAHRSPGVVIAMKRSGSDSLRPRSGDGSSAGLSEQTQLLFRKMLVLERKIQSMETQLKEEQVQRLHLEAKVVKLEEENQGLKRNRETASKQLQSFADQFYLATEDIRIGSLSPSPYPSLAELRTVSRRDSACSSASIFSRDSTGSRYSGISVTSQS